MDFTYMNRHVEIVRLELVGHFSEALQAVLPHSLLEAECLSGLIALLTKKRTTQFYCALIKSTDLIVNFQVSERQKCRCGHMTVSRSRSSEQTEQIFLATVKQSGGKWELTPTHATMRKLLTNLESLSLTSATHLGQRQSPLGTSCRGGIRQKVW